MTHSPESYYLHKPDRLIPHGDPKIQWVDLHERNVPLATRIPYERWTEITHGKVPDLTLAQYLSARHVANSSPIPSRIKDAVVISKPNWIRRELNHWNRDTGHYRRKYPFFDLRMDTPIAAIAASAMHGYIPYEKGSQQLDNIVWVLFEMSTDLGLLEYTRWMGTNPPEKSGIMYIDGRGKLHQIK